MTDTYSYAAVETALARVFGADASAQKGAFRGRIKHLQRLGLLSETPGKGRKIAYTDAQVCAWLIALELEEFGIDPALAVRMITGWVGPDQESEAWKQYLPAVISAARSSQGGDDDTFLMVEPFFMSAGWRGDPKFDPANFRDVRIGEIKEFLDLYLSRPKQRACIFNLSARLRNLDEELEAAQKAESKTA